MISKKQAIDIVHKTIYEFFDIVDDNSEEPMTEKDIVLLEVNKKICNNIKNAWKLQNVTPKKKLSKLLNIWTFKI